MFTLGLRNTGRVSGVRLFLSSLSLGAAAPAVDKATAAKAQLKKLMKKRTLNKQPASAHPLYMDIPTAMRYLRAAEVGQPARKTTVAVNLSVVPGKKSQPIQGKVHFPKGFKQNSAIVFVKDSSIAEKIQGISDKILVGGTDLIQKISKSEVDISPYNQAYAHPDIVGDLRTIARALGPRGLMPLEKKGTVSRQLVELIEEGFSAVHFKQSGPMINIPIGRCDFSDEDIIKNLRAASKAIVDGQADMKEPNLIGKAHLSTTLGPSIVIDFKG